MTYKYNPFTGELDQVLTASDIESTTLYTADSGTATPESDNINILAATVVAGTSPASTLASGSTLTVNIQISQAVAAADATTVGLANFDSSDFDVDSDGFVTINAGAGSLDWTVITADQTAVVNNGYVCNKGSALELLLPATAVVGDIIRVTGINTALGIQITQNADQQIHLGSASTTLGIAGSIQSINIRNSLELVVVVPGTSTIWNVISSIGIWNLN